MDRNYHALEFVPRQSDPERKWALSVKQPLAALIARGLTRIVTKSQAPPPELIGKRIALHAGAGNVPYKAFSEHAAEWAKAAFGAELRDLRHLLPHGGVIATVELEAAFRIGRVIDGHAWANPLGKFSAHYAGRWKGHDGTRVFEQGDIDGRWAWALTAPELCKRTVPLRGYGGIFDLERAREIEAQAQQGDAA